jgi:signal transduction histidine kinase
MPRPIYAYRVSTPADLWLPGLRSRWSAHPARVDLLIVAVVALVEMTATSFAAPHQDNRAAMDAGAYALLAAGAVALLFRRPYPTATLAAAFGATLAYWLLDYPRGPIFLALIVAFVNAVIRGRRAAAWTSLALGWAAFVWLGNLADVQDNGVGEALGTAAWLLAVGAGSELIRARVERAQQARLTREEEARRRVGEERLRIARELHDVLAHNVSLINVQAGVALHLMDDRPEQAGTALAAIKQASAETLRELRSVLGTLRQVDEEVPRSPAPSLRDLHGLIARMQRAGIGVEVTRDGDLGDLPAAVDLAGYRILQEALTNVARHSGGAAARVRVGRSDGDLLLAVEDQGPGGGAAGFVEGNGIAGMRERALSLGGDFQAGPRADGGFEVLARLPIEGEA